MNSKSHLRKAGHLGGLARMKKYGNPGTQAGRRLGGLNSIKTHKLKNTGFNTLKKIIFPKKSKELAELIGIFMGDGHVGKYQSSITTNSQTDVSHALYVKNLLEKLFNVRANLRFRSDSKACELVVSSKEVSRFLESQGMPCGSKIRDGVRIPEWIIRNDVFIKAFLRGLFDTDGCVYMDNHKYKNLVYKNIGIAFTNYELSILAFFKDQLESLGLHPTQKTKHTVFLRRSKEIQRYFDLVGTSNPKHKNRYLEFLEIRRSGGVG